MKFYSQQYEDSVLFKKYLNYRNGYFIELGAMDGIVYSNTKFFEDHLGWTGLLIEPEKNQFKKLKENRPNCTSLEYAVSEVEGEVTFNSRNGGDSGGGIVETHIDKTIVATDNYTVVSKPFYKIFEEIGKPKKVDLFIVDVEGGELAILKTFDWSVPVYIIVIETHESNKDNDDCRKILTTNGFELDMILGCNEVWINKKFQEQTHE